ncbi:hypothetical protein AA18895_0005 [Acetobacter ghanensis DSM 18895]|nr:hypothetical protein AA18895_0005 [Acetobacter ghanensis DSM 18895]
MDGMCGWERVTVQRILRITVGQAGCALHDALADRAVQYFSIMRYGNIRKQAKPVLPR